MQPSGVRGDGWRALILLDVGGPNSAALALIGASPHRPIPLHDRPSATIARVVGSSRTRQVYEKIGFCRWRLEVQFSISNDAHFFRRAFFRAAVTGCDVEILRASYVKPWKNSNNDEWLDSQNGLLLGAHLDALFDAGLISFDDSGAMLVSKLMSNGAKSELGLGRPLMKMPSVDRRRILARRFFTSCARSAKKSLTSSANFLVESARSAIVLLTRPASLAVSGMAAD